jgi:hypothetical protein
MLEKIRNKLIEVAKTNDVISYGELANFAEMPFDLDSERNKLYAILDEINRREDAQGRPMLSILVVHKDDKTPGPGFFKLAKHIGKQKKGISNDEFFRKELINVLDYWASHS